MVASTKYTLLFTIIITTILLQRTSSQSQQNTENWWCGLSHADASTSCSRPCQNGHCPVGTVCFSGVTTCTTMRYCGASLADANSKCSVPCPYGRGEECPNGEGCFLNTQCDKAGFGDGSAGSISSGGPAGPPAGISPVGSDNAPSTPSFASQGAPSPSSPSTSSATILGLTGTSAVEETFLQMENVINNKFFLYETPMMEWIPSTVYRFDGFFDGLRVMHSQGVAGKTLYLGGDDKDCKHCHMYGLVNVAAFLAQAMKETIRYNACDENSWDRVGVDLMYPISNSCGQLGQSYQDYYCKDDERHYECEVDPEMTITAVTNAKWWGAPAPLQCGPKSLYPQTGYWDFQYLCDNQWGNPPETCSAYEEQQGGKAINDQPYPNAAGRTDVEGCCWWGRGVIQTSGICNFGKFNYYLGKRAADEGRESRYPDIDFCRDPEAICSREDHPELKWIAGFFYWISEVQTYDEGGWNYIEQLHKFVDSGMNGVAFINAVSGIVNRGCHNPPCGTGALDGGPERAANFFDVVEEMQFAFVDVVPQSQTTPEQLANRPLPDPISFPQKTPWPTNPPFPTPVSPLAPAPFTSPTPPLANTPSAVTSETALSFDGTSEIRFNCAEFDGSDTSIPPSSYVSFDYELHNGIDVTVGDALRDVKASILADIASRMGCYKTNGRELQDSFEGFESIIGLQSNANDLPDPDVAGCMVDVQTVDPAVCTPVSGGFTIYAVPGTSESSLRETSNVLKSIVETGMGSGQYETQTVVKAIYIGDRTNSVDVQAAQSAHSEGAEEDNEKMKIALYVLACACLVLICVLWFTIWTYREKAQKARRTHDEELAFNTFMIDKSEKSENTSHSIPNMMNAPQVGDYVTESQRRPQAPPRQLSQRQRSRLEILKDRAIQNGDGDEFPQRTRSGSAGRRESAPPILREREEERERLLVSSRSPPAESFQRRPAAQRSQSESAARFRSNSAPRFQSDSRERNPPLMKRPSSAGGSVSGDSSYSSGSESSEDEGFNDGERKTPVVPEIPMNGSNIPYSRGSSNGGHNNNNDSMGMESFQRSLQSNLSSREERQKRMAAARARAANRRSVS